MVKLSTPTFLGCWVLIIFNTCHLFPRGWSPYFSWCDGTCQNQHLPLIVSPIKYSNCTTLCCPLLGLSFEHLMVHLYHHFLMVWWSVYRNMSLPNFNICSFEHYVNMFPILCKFSCICLVINPSYHTCIPFVLYSFPYN